MELHVPRCVSVAVAALSLLAACGSDEAQEIEYSADLEPGVTYRYDFRVHCDMEWLGEFDDRSWRWVDGMDRSFSSMDPNPRNWPIEGQSLQGSLTLVDDDRLEYSIDDEVIAAYEPTDEAPPGCI
jgi:hypothetical protein